MTDLLPIHIENVCSELSIQTAALNALPMRPVEGIDSALALSIKDDRAYGGLAGDSLRLRVSQSTADNQQE